MQNYIDRRGFLLGTAAVGALAGARVEAAGDPFDALPAEVRRNARRNGLIMVRHPAPPGIASRAALVQPGEPGDPLVVTVRVFTPDGKTTAPGVTVYAYNTDAQGYYGASRSEYPPRLFGWARTDASGEVELRTIRPGRYPGMRVPAHVHFALWDGGYPPQWSDELEFAGDSYLTEAMLAEDRARGEFACVHELARSADGVWRCSHRIRLRRESNFGA